MVPGKLAKRFRGVKLAAAGLLVSAILAAQDPAEPPASVATGTPAAPAGAAARSSVDEKALAATVAELVACGTRHSLSSWDDPKRGIGCARDRILARYRRLVEPSGGGQERLRPFGLRSVSSGIRS